MAAEIQIEWQRITVAKLPYIGIFLADIFTV